MAAVFEEQEIIVVKIEEIKNKKKEEREGEQKSEKYTDLEVKYSKGPRKRKKNNMGTMKQKSRVVCIELPLILNIRPSLNF